MRISFCVIYVCYYIIYINEYLNFNAAFVIRNFGTQLTTYAGTKESLPFEVDLGFSQKLENVPLRWHVTFENLQQWPIASVNPARGTTDLNGTQTPEEVGFFSNVLRHTIVGAELFPDKGFNIRLGYSFRRAAELKILEQRNFSGLSIGFGLKMGNLKFNYSYSRYTIAANTSLFGLTIDFSNDR